MNSIKGPHAVYRLYGPDGIMLYIGMSKRPRARLAVHRHNHRYSWWPWVERQEVEWFATHREAARVETDAIRLHRPLCNPVIPNADGRHVTMTASGQPVRSLWDQAADIAHQRGETLSDVIRRALEAYVRRHR